MKRILSILILMLTAISGGARNKAVLGIDMSRVLRDGDIKIVAGYGFHERWSVRYSTAISTDPIRKTTDPEYECHKEELSTSYGKTAIHPSSTLSMQYWTRNAYEGTFLEIGCRYGFNTRTDCIIGLGYCIPIWKGLSAVISCSTDMISTFDERQYFGEGISLDICWSIGKR